MEKLRRSKRNKVIFGVCAGISDYLRIDVTLVRIVAILSTFMGFGIPVYIVAALIMPEEKDYSPFDNQWGSQNTSSYGSDPFTGNGTGAGTGSNTGTGADSFESDFSSEADNWDTPRYHPERSKFILGAILVVVGVMALGYQILPALFNPRVMFPLFLIIIGGLIVFRGRK